MYKNKSESRLQNSKRNVFTGLFSQFSIIVSNFVVRTVVLYVLGKLYVGLGSLFSSILQVLNLSELGFSAAVTFVLYKPIAEKDNDTVCSILAFLKHAYRIIGIVILVVGLFILPFIKLLIKDEYPNEINLYILYSIYLANAVVSYLLYAYKSTLLTAMQRNDLVTNAFTIAYIIGKLLQIIVIVFFRNIYLYAMAIVIASVLNSFLIEYNSRRVYPEIRAYGVIPKSAKEVLLKQVKAVFLNKLGDVARNSFDNIVLSFFLGLAAVTAYGNYYYIFAAVYGVTGIIVHSLRASIGNSLVKENSEKNYQDLLLFSFAFMWIVGWCTISMLVLYQPFMLIWMKGDKALLLSFGDMSLFCMYYYAMSMAYTKNAYLEAEGLFHESRFLYVGEAISNLVLNFLLCALLGTTGILLATIITIFLFNFVGGTFVLFKHYFLTSPREFMVRHVVSFLVTVVAGVITYFIANLISLQGILGLMIKVFICMFVPNLLFILCYFKSRYFHQSLLIIKRLI